MTKIFVCYRRDDSADTAERIVEHLTEISGKFSAGDIFFDVESIPVGVNFRTHIDERVSQCVVMLVVIGPDWAAITNASSGNMRGAVKAVACKHILSSCPNTRSYTENKG